MVILGNYTDNYDYYDTATTAAYKSMGFDHSAIQSYVVVAVSVS